MQVTGLVRKTVAGISTGKNEKRSLQLPRQRRPSSVKVTDFTGIRKALILRISAFLIVLFFMRPGLGHALTLNGS